MLFFALTVGGAAAVGPGLGPLFDAATSAANQLLAMLECKDENPGCPSWAKSGECKNNPGFMHSTCRKACARCDLSGEDAQHALEIGTYAARNLNAGCSSVKPATPACAGSAERLAAVLAMAQAPGQGSGLQRFLEALAHEVLADASLASPAAGTFEPIQPTAATAAASVGGTTAHPFVRLSDGGQMPAVGLGTWLTVGQACYDMVAAGLRAGLRHIDTSENYANHEEIGRALSDSAVPRSELFLADKLSFPQSYSTAGVRKAVADSLRKLRTDYLDLLMLHSVGPGMAARHEAWAAMVALQKEVWAEPYSSSTSDSLPSLSPFPPLTPSPAALPALFTQFGGMGCNTSVRLAPTRSHPDPTQTPPRPHPDPPQPTHMHTSRQRPTHPTHTHASRPLHLPEEVVTVQLSKPR